MTASIRFSSVTVNCPDAATLAAFYADVANGSVTFSHPSWATMECDGGRIDFQTVPNHVAPRWPETPGLVHLDFLVENLGAAEARVVDAGARKYEFQPNAEHCLVFADPVGNPFCLTTLDEIG